jgi:hypothetical protein
MSSPSEFSKLTGISNNIRTLETIAVRYRSRFKLPPKRGETDYDAEYSSSSSRALGLSRFRLIWPGASRTLPRFRFIRDDFSVARARDGVE